MEPGRARRLRVPLLRAAPRGDIILLLLQRDGNLGTKQDLLLREQGGSNYYWEPNRFEGKAWGGPQGGARRLQGEEAWLRLRLLRLRLPVPGHGHKTWWWREQRGGRKCRSWLFRECRHGARAE